jgi:hypothetical protein
MRSGFVAIAGMWAQAPGNFLLKKPQLVTAFGCTKPEHPRRTAMRKDTQPLERDPERRDPEWPGQCENRAPLEVLVRLPEKPKRQMQPALVHPGDPAKGSGFPNPFAQRGRDSTDGLPCLRVEIDRQEQTFHSISQRRAMSIAACDA